MPHTMNEFLRRLGYLPMAAHAPSIQDQQRKMDSIIIGVHTSTSDLHDKINKLEEILREKPKT